MIIIIKFQRNKMNNKEPATILKNMNLNNMIISEQDPEELFELLEQLGEGSFG